MKTLIYFSGYKGHNSNKFTILKDYFSELRVIQFNQTFNFEADNILIDGIIDKYPEDKIILIGSSLGCIPAINTGLKYDMPIILINPSYFPELTLKDDLSPSEMTALSIYKTNIETYLRYDPSGLFPKIDLFISEDDERISESNRKEFLKIFSKYINCIDKSGVGKHEYNILKDKLLKIRAFIYGREITIEDFFQLN